MPKSAARGGVPSPTKSGTYTNPRQAMTSDYFDGVPDCTRLAREIGQEIAATRPPNVLAHKGRVFWKLTDGASGALASFAFTPPDARSELAGLGGKNAWNGPRRR